MRNQRVFLASLFSVAVTALVVLMPAAQSVSTIPINFISIDVDKFTFPRNSEVPRSKNPNVVAVFPPCGSSINTDCIKSVEYQDLKGQWIQGKFFQPLPYKFNVVDKSDYSEQVIEESTNLVSFKADPARNIPALSRSGYWTFPGLKQSGGDKFLVDFTALGSMSNNENPLASDSRAQWIRIQSVRIAPVTPLVLKTSEIKSKNPKGSPTFSGCGGNGNNDKSFCWMRNEFIGDPTFRISVRLNKTVGLLDSSLWFTARTKSSSIGVSKDATGTVITFSGKPVMIGNASTNLPRTEATYDLVKRLINIGTKEYDPNYDASMFYSLTQFLDAYDFALGTETLESVNQWNALESVSPLKIISENGVWRYTPAEVNSPNDLKSIINEKCTTKAGVLGMASSNAAVFVPTIPIWNSETGSLDFQIASTHLNKKGKLNTGYYGISVSESVAKCLWSVNSSKISAQISISNQDEQKTVNLMSSSLNNGFYNFNVSGFHYSAPKISLKIQNS